MGKVVLVSFTLALFMVLHTAGAQDTDFVELVKSGTAQQVADAIDQGANYNAQDEDGVTPLMIAAAINQNPSVITELLNAGANIKARNSEGTTPIMYAAQNQNPGVITALMNAGATLKERDDHGRTPFIFAAATNPNPAIIAMLLKAGSTIDEHDNEGATPLMYAAVNNPNPAIITTLLKAGAKVLDKDRGVITLLLAGASKYNHPEVITVLLKAGAKPNYSDRSGMTPMMNAAATNLDPAVITTLLKAGADIKARSSEGMTSLMIAAKSNQNPEVIATLIKAGAAINARDNNGVTPLMYAAANNENPLVIAAFLKAGAVKNAKDNEGKTVAEYARDNPGWRLPEETNAYLRLREDLKGFLPLITTVAGNGEESYSGDGGPATTAALRRPKGVAVDVAGNIYIADSGNHSIRKVDTSGNISTVAGNGKESYSGDGGLATSAALRGPSGLAVDVAGNIYIADYGNYRIRKVDTNGNISTVAGNGKESYSGDGGPATSAAFKPDGVAVDIAGNIFIADGWGDNRIRKVSTDGTITTVAGTATASFKGDGGAATSAQLWSPHGVAVDSAGNIYIADYGNNRIRKVDAGGTITTVAGNGKEGYSGDGGLATSAAIGSPIGVAVDVAGNLYIADGNGRIRKMNTSGIITTLAGGGNLKYGQSVDSGWAVSAILRLGSLAVDVQGNIYICDFGNHKVRKVLQ